MLLGPQVKQRALGRRQQDVPLGTPQDGDEVAAAIVVSLGDDAAGAEAAVDAAVGLGVGDEKGRHRPKVGNVVQDPPLVADRVELEVIVRRLDVLRLGFLGTLQPLFEAQHHRTGRRLVVFRRLVPAPLPKVHEMVGVGRRHPLLAWAKLANEVCVLLPFLDRLVNTGDIVHLERHLIVSQEVSSGPLSDVLVVEDFEGAVGDPGNVRNVRVVGRPPREQRGQRHELRVRQVVLDCLFIRGSPVDTAVVVSAPDVTVRQWDVLARAVEKGLAGRKVLARGWDGGRQEHSASRVDRFLPAVPNPDGGLRRSGRLCVVSLGCGGRRDVGVLPSPRSVLVVVGDGH
mmetsp:Transcript_17305/g.45148  ORF Transcript_17305/g.45148 Transcript_17305/m.45148 type:complete len:343 (-) Transcript_17305:1330-2358(-)